MKLYYLMLFAWFLACSCNDSGQTAGQTDTLTYSYPRVTDVESESDPLKTVSINTGTTEPEELLSYARSLIGTPYKYGSIDPDEGLDCSGFITTVFNHFRITVPRSSKDFINVERPVSLRNSRPGDLILFTGTDSTVRQVGHMGIIVDNNGREIDFIHSTSGKADGVTITPLNNYYEGRFVKVIRVFNAVDSGE